MRPAIVIMGLLLLLLGCTTSLTGQTTLSFLQDRGDLQLYFCPGENCEEIFVQALDTAQESLHCALFEVELESLKKVLLEKQQQMDVQIVTDNDYINQFNHSFVRADSWGLMHNKFCIIDGK